MSPVEDVAAAAPEVAEPAPKKAKGADGTAVAKTGWEGYTLNVAEAVTVDVEGAHLTSIADGPVSALQGIGPVAAKVAEILGINTVRDLANYKFFKLARAIVALQPTEVQGKRPAGSVMNFDKAVG
jgi:predicted flap endonuclease-1-like 5' DNA nuclease